MTSTTGVRLNTLAALRRLDPSEITPIVRRALEYDRVMEQHAALIRFLLDLADEARAAAAVLRRPKDGNTAHIRTHIPPEFRRRRKNTHERNTSMETAVRPYAIRRDEGEKLSFFGSLTWFKATGEQTGGVLALIEHVVPPGTGSPWHVHHNEDECFYVLEGEILFIVGEEQRITSGPGTYVFGPRDIPHGFRNDSSAPARMLVETTPAGFDQFVLALAEPASPSGFAPATPPDMQKLMAEAARANIEILGPLPE